MLCDVMSVHLCAKTNVWQSHKATVTSYEWCMYFPGQGAIKYIIISSFIKIGPVMALKSHSTCQTLTRTNYKKYEHQNLDS